MSQLTQDQEEIDEEMIFQELEENDNIDDLIVGEIYRVVPSQSDSLDRIKRMQEMLDSMEKRLKTAEAEISELSKSEGKLEEYVKQVEEASSKGMDEIKTYGYSVYQAAAIGGLMDQSINSMAPNRYYTWISEEQWKSINSTDKTTDMNGSSVFDDTPVATFGVRMVLNNYIRRAVKELRKVKDDAEISDSGVLQMVLPTWFEKVIQAMFGVKASTINLTWVDTKDGIRLSIGTRMSIDVELGPYDVMIVEFLCINDSQISTKKDQTGKELDKMEIDEDAKVSWHTKAKIRVSSVSLSDRIETVLDSDSKEYIELSLKDDVVSNSLFEKETVLNDAGPLLRGKMSNHSINVSDIVGLTFIQDVDTFPWTTTTTYRELDFYFSRMREEHYYISLDKPVMEANRKRDEIMSKVETDYKTSLYNPTSENTGLSASLGLLSDLAIRMSATPHEVLEEVPPGMMWVSGICDNPIYGKDQYKLYNNVSGDAGTDFSPYETRGSIRALGPGELRPGSNNIKAMAFSRWKITTTLGIDMPIPQARQTISIQDIDENWAMAVHLTYVCRAEITASSNQAIKRLEAGLAHANIKGTDFCYAAQGIIGLKTPKKVTFSTTDSSYQYTGEQVTFDGDSVNMALEIKGIFLIRKGITNPSTLQDLGTSYVDIAFSGTVQTIQITDWTSAEIELNNQQYYGLKATIPSSYAKSISGNIYYSPSYDGGNIISLPDGNSLSQAGPWKITSSVQTDGYFDLFLPGTIYYMKGAIEMTWANATDYSPSIQDSMRFPSIPLDYSDFATKYDIKVSEMAEDLDGVNWIWSEHMRSMCYATVGLRIQGGMTVRSILNPTPANVIYSVDSNKSVTEAAIDYLFYANDQLVQQIDREGLQSLLLETQQLAAESAGMDILEVVSAVASLFSNYLITIGIQLTKAALKLLTAASVKVLRGFFSVMKKTIGRRYIYDLKHATLDSTWNIFSGLYTLCGIVARRHDKEFFDDSVKLIRTEAKEAVSHAKSPRIYYSPGDAATYALEVSRGIKEGTAANYLAKGYNPGHVLGEATYHAYAFSPNSPPAAAISKFLKDVAVGGVVNDAIKGRLTSSIKSCLKPFHTEVHIIHIEPMVLGDDIVDVLVHTHIGVGSRSTLVDGKGGAFSTVVGSFQYRQVIMSSFKDELGNVRYITKSLPVENCGYTEQEIRTIARDMKIDNADYANLQSLWDQAGAYIKARASSGTALAKSIGYDATLINSMARIFNTADYKYSLLHMNCQDLANEILSARHMVETHNGGLLGDKWSRTLSKTYASICEKDLPGLIDAAKKR